MKASTIKALNGQSVIVTKGYSLWSGTLLPDQGYWTVRDRFQILRFVTKDVESITSGVIKLKERK